MTAGRQGETIYLTREGKGDRIPAVVMGKGKPLFEFIVKPRLLGEVNRCMQQ